MAISNIYSKLPRFAQVLVEDSQRLNEYPRFMRLLLTFGTPFFLYKFTQTMQYLESEKHSETPEQRIARRQKEKEMRDKLTKEALSATQINPPSNKHIEDVIARANRDI